MRKSDLNKVLKALADPTRREIFDLILMSDKRESISTVSNQFKITRQGITKHLKMLEQGKLVKLKRIGRVTYCSAHPEPIQKLELWLKDYQTQRAPQEEPLMTTDESSFKDSIVTEANAGISTEKNNSEQEEVFEDETAQQTTKLIQLNIDPNDPGQPVKVEPESEPPTTKIVKEKPIEISENQLDIYGIRKEPKVNEDQQLEMF